jgi:hypothetical protein
MGVTHLYANTPKMMQDRAWVNLEMLPDYRQ